MEMSTMPFISFILYYALKETFTRILPVSSDMTPTHEQEDSSDAATSRLGSPEPTLLTLKRTAPSDNDQETGQVLARPTKRRKL
jgi:hypothetical protein